MIQKNSQRSHLSQDQQRRIRNRLALALITAAFAGATISSTMSNDAYAKVSSAAQSAPVQEIRLSDGTKFNYKSVSAEDINKELLRIVEDSHKNFMEIKKNQDYYLIMLDRGYSQEEAGTIYKESVRLPDWEIANRLKDLDSISDFSSEVVFSDENGNRMAPREIRANIGVVKAYLEHLVDLRDDWEVGRQNMKNAQIDFSVHDGNVVQNIGATIKTDRHSDYGDIDWQTFADRLSNLSESDVGMGM